MNKHCAIHWWIQHVCSQCNCILKRIDHYDVHTAGCCAVLNVEWNSIDEDSETDDDVIGSNDCSTHSLDKKLDHLQNVIFLTGIHSMQGWTTTTRKGVTKEKYNTYKKYV